MAVQLVAQRLNGRKRNAGQMESWVWLYVRLCRWDCRIDVFRLSLYILPVVYFIFLYQNCVVPCRSREKGGRYVLVHEGLALVGEKVENRNAID
jgi:hypothetical protein